MLAGPHHAHISELEQAFGVVIRDESSLFRITGPAAAVQDAELAIKALLDIARQRDFDTHDVIAVIRHGGDADNAAAAIATRKKTVVAKTPKQSDYIRAIQSKELVFGIGPAGTGKTYLATAYAAAQLEAGAIDRIILTRPAVEAGERLGFLPGDMKEKVDPYLRPLYDALYDMLPPERVARAIESGAIEIAPLAFMRGRTLSNAVVLVDEAQNTSSMQMKMVLTRLGENSRMIITGDPSQTDLPPGQISGLKEAVNVLSGIDEIGIITFTNRDVVRHKLVGKIVDAYDRTRSAHAKSPDA
ncbi:MAG: PhoH family protein [Rhodospirillales bacterium]|nr:PhoH family protein [Alphaproteobacteria bacterium]MCB9987440.1 PhoH family protein [Rhodospirillales bacterium]USO08651.1 MAG: PhoH family protein [Rhodospirillales bacterium]